MENRNTANKDKNTKDPIRDLWRSDKVFQILTVFSFILFVSTNINCWMEECQWMILNYFLYILLIAFGFKLGYAMCKSNIRKSHQALKEMICE